MGGSAADTTDWQGLQTGITNAAKQQTANNRINTSSPFASQTFNPDGSTSTQFAGGLGQAASGLAGQAAGLAKPLGWNQFGTVGTGDQARDSAINGAYGQATSRLDPMWDRREEAQRTRLLNQGLEAGSEAYQNSMGDMGMQRNDAYNQAMFSAIGQGTQAGHTAFGDNMMSQQNAIANALRQRGQPVAEMQQLQGLLGQPGYNADGSSLQGAMGSANLAQNASLQKQRADEAAAQGAAGTAGGIMSGIGTAAGIAAMFF